MYKILITDLDELKQI